jgi:chromosome segregation ATPase
MLKKILLLLLLFSLLHLPVFSLENQYQNQSTQDLWMTLQTELLNLNTQILNSENLIQTLKLQIKDLEKQISNLLLNLDNLEIISTEQKTLLNQQEQQLLTLNQLLENQENQLIELRKSSESLQKEIKSLNTKVTIYRGVTITLTVALGMGVILYLLK